jgi:hypothetical protein
MDPQGYREGAKRPSSVPVRAAGGVGGEPVTAPTQNLHTKNNKTERKGTYKILMNFKQFFHSE